MALCPEGRHFVAASSELNCAYIYNTKEVSAPPQAVAHAGKSSVQSVDWSLQPSVNAILAAASDGIVRVLEIAEQPQSR